MADGTDDSAGASEAQVELAATVILYGFGVVALVLGVIGGSLVVGGVMDRQQGLSEADATTEATVLNTTIEAVHSSARSGETTDYEARVAYRYTVNGTEYTGRNIYPGKDAVTMDTEEGAREFLAPYGDGEQVTVHYDPGRPERAFLEARPMPLPKLLGGIGAVIVFLLGGFGALWKGYGVGRDD